MNKKNKSVFLGCFYAFFVNGMSALMLGAVLPAILTDYGMGYDDGGLLLSFQSIGNLIASFLGGIIPNYLGRKKAIIILSSLSALGFTGMLITKTPIVLLIMFFMTGIGRGSVSNLGNAIVNDASSGDTRLLNVLHTFFAVGAFMAPFVASWCFAKGLGWKYAVVTVAVLAFVMVTTFSMIKIDDTKERTQKRVGIKISYNFLKNINFYISSGILFFYVGVEYAVNGWIVTYLKDTGIMSTSLAQKILSMLWVVIIFGRLSCAHISKTVNKETILLASSIGTMVFFVLFMMSSKLWTIIFCILGLGFCLSGIYPTTIANAGDVLKGSGLAMGTLLAIAGLGGIIMPYITGAIAANKGIAGGMTAIAVAIVFMLLFSLINKLKVKENVKGTH